MIVWIFMLHLMNTIMVVMTVTGIGSSPAAMEALETTITAIATFLAAGRTTTKMILKTTNMPIISSSQKIKTEVDIKWD